MKLLGLFCFFLLLETFLFNAIQGQILKPNLSIESAIKASAGENVPYYLISGQHGVYTKNNSALLRVAIKNELDSSKAFSMSYAIDGIYRFDGHNDVWLQQSFVKVKILKYFLIQGGLLEEDFGNQDNLLSAGNYLYSNNARPMPKMAILTNDYIPIPFTKNLLEFKAYLSQGWFGTKDQFVEHAFLHQKYLYIRFGEKRYKWDFDLGIHHTAMWGGTSPDYGKLPDDWNAYKSVLLGRMQDDMGPLNEQKNVLGNHLASYSLGFNYKFTNHAISFYWQTMLEDKNGRVGLDWKNKGDGLWGIVLKKDEKSNGFNKIVLEFFNSTSQSGDPTKSGGDNYFNNYLYRSGWTYMDMTIGSPLITSPAFKGNPDVPGGINVYSNYLENNRIRAIHTGLLYYVCGNPILIKLTYSRNFGTIAVPYPHPKDQLYSLIEYSCKSKRFQDLIYIWQGAFDLGSYLGNSAGIMFKVRKTF